MKLVARVLVSGCLCTPSVALQPGQPAQDSRHQDDASAIIDAAKAKRKAWLALPASEVTPDPDSARFPGPVPSDAVRVSDHRIEVDLNPIRWRNKSPWWESTGLYAPPGEVVTIIVPPEAISLHLGVRIGAHKDNSNPKAKSWKRTPVNLTNVWPLDAAAVKVANPFGGPIYIEVPARDDNASIPGAATLRVTGAVEAPLFVAGRTTPEEWRTIRMKPGPWAELGCDHLWLTVPSESIRTLDDPSELMHFWEKGMELVHELSGGEFTAERLVFDPSISAGYMHSGYPIMCSGGLDAMVDVKRLRAGDVWGFFHEIGHNNRYGGWTPRGQGEVTNNWFPMYMRDVGLGLPGFDRKEPKIDYSQPLARGAIGTGDQGPQGPWVGLTFWRQIQEEFGWEPFRDVLAQVHSKEFSAAKSDEGKWDELLVRLSTATNRDLSPHFQAWGAEISDEGAAKVKSLLLEPWMSAKAPGQPGAPELNEKAQREPGRKSPASLK